MRDNAASSTGDRPIYRAIREHEREECLDLWTTVWPGENSRKYFARYFYGDVEWLPYYTQVAEVEGRLVSAVQICKRMVSCGEFCLAMGGIANVATLPEYRGNGYNTGCLKNAIAVMEADALDFSLLFTGINEYYRQFGFSDLGRASTAVVLRRDQPVKSLSDMFSVRCARPSDVPAIRAIYDDYNRTRPIAVRRSQAYWREWLGIDDSSELPPGLIVAEDRAGNIVGYVYSGVFNSAVPYSAEEAAARIIEFGVTELSPRMEADVTDCLLNAAAAVVPSAGRRTLRLEIAETVPVQRALEEIAEPGGISYASIDSGMVRLLHPDNLLRSLTMVLNDRWIAAGSPMGRLAFETPYGTTNLAAAGPFLQVEKAEVEKAEQAAVLTQSALFGLLFGALDPKQVTDDIGLHPLISALFPRQEMVYWGPDGI